MPMTRRAASTLHHQQSQQVIAKDRTRCRQMRQKHIDAVRMNSSAIIGLSAYRLQHVVTHIRIVLIGNWLFFSLLSEYYADVKYCSFSIVIRSDELNCTTIKPRTNNNYTFNDHGCAHPDRTCAANGNCIRVDQLCDGKTDCPDGGCMDFQLNPKSLYICSSTIVSIGFRCVRFGWRSSVWREIMWSECRV